MSTEWEKRAKCRSAKNPGLWFSNDPYDRAEAKNICATCPVKDDCLAGAVERRERDGIWGERDFGEPWREKHRREQRRHVA